jgi:GNAT superfamily N-acetyltransferase
MHDPRVDEQTLSALARNCGGYYLAGARAIGKPWRAEEDLLLSDLGLPVAAPPNNATIIRRPESPDAAERLVERAVEFFGAAPGGGFQVWSVWPSVDLAPYGLSSTTTPCMIRKAGGGTRPAPPELEIEEVRDDRGVGEAWGLINRAFLGGRARERLWDVRVLSDDFRTWLGRVDGRPVTTATAFMDAGYVGIYAVATDAAARGRGYGEAITWAATLCRPDLPATLQASGMGQPVYERMGYGTVATFTVWVRNDRTPS